MELLLLLVLFVYVCMFLSGLFVYVCIFLSGLNDSDYLPEQTVSKADPGEATCQHCGKLLCAAIACPSPHCKHR